MSRKSKGFKNNKPKRHGSSFFTLPRWCITPALLSQLKPPKALMYLSVAPSPDWRGHG